MLYIMNVYSGSDQPHLLLINAYTAEDAITQMGKRSRSTTIIGIRPVIMVDEIRGVNTAQVDDWGVVRGWPIPKPVQLG